MKVALVYYRFNADVVFLGESKCILSSSLYNVTLLNTLVSINKIEFEFEFDIPTVHTE